MIRKVTSGKVDTATELQKELQEGLNVKVNPKTIRKTLKRAGMKAITKKKRPLLLRRHLKLRLEFANKYKYWAADDWNRVIFSDETKINRLRSDGRLWVWKKRDTPTTIQHISPTVKFGGGSLMMWGCMASQGIGYACKIDGKMDAELYKNILRDEFLDTIEYYELDHSKVVFQQDNDPKHTSKKAREWFQTNNIRLLDWPP